MQKVIHMDYLSYNIKIIRGITKLSQSGFAEQMQVSLSMQKSYESGRAKPDHLYIQRLSQLTRVNENELLTKKLLEKDIPVKVEFDEKDDKDKMIFSTIPEHFADIQERLIRAEAHLEVYESAIAELLSKAPGDFAKVVGELRKAVQEAVNRRFDELHRKSA